MDVDVSTKLGPWLQAELVRGVIFYPPATSADALSIWTTLIGTSPDQFNKAQGALQSTARGEWNGYTLTIGVQPGRIELGLTAPDPTPELPTLLPSIDDVEAAADRCRSLTKQLASKFEVVRAAAHLNVVRDVKDQADAAATLNKLLEMDLFKADHRELRYNLNSPVPGKSLKGLEINRICVWGTGAQQAVAIPISPNAVSAPQRASVREIAFLRIDVNNKPLDRPLAQGDCTVQTLVDELWDGALQILKEGKRAV